jgi:uncharacterized protein YcfJ
MKSAGGYIGAIVGLIIGGITGVSAIVLFATIICCLIGRYIGKSIGEDLELQKQKAFEAQRRRTYEEYENKRKAERRIKAQDLARKYPAATKYYFKIHWGQIKSTISDLDITDDKVDQLLSHEESYERDELTHSVLYRISKDLEQANKRMDEIAFREIERKQEIAREKVEQLERQNLATTLPACVSQWYTHTINGSIKHKWFVDYYPYNRYKSEANNSIRADWALVWNFKNDNRISPYEHTEALNKVVQLTEDALKSAFGNKVKYLTLVCLAASTSKATKERFEEFSNKVCADLGMENGLLHIHIVSDVIPKRLGGTGKPQKQYDEWFFRNKYVILFDDVRTSGYSLEMEKAKLTSMGAMVIGAITIAQTMS